MVWILLEWNIYAFYTNKDTVLLTPLQASWLLFVELFMASFCRTLHGFFLSNSSWLLFVELLTGDLAYSMLHNSME